MKGRSTYPDTASQANTSTTRTAVVRPCLRRRTPAVVARRLGTGWVMYPTTCTAVVGTIIFLKFVNSIGELGGKKIYFKKLSLCRILVSGY